MNIEQTEIRAIRLINQFTGTIQIDFCNRTNGFFVWSHNFYCNDLNKLCDANKIQDQEDRIKALYLIVSSQVYNYIENWEFENS